MPTHNMHTSIEVLVDVQAEEIDVASQTRRAMTTLIPMATQVISETLRTGRGDPTACKMAKWVIELGLGQQAQPGVETERHSSNESYARTLRLVT